MEGRTLKVWWSKCGSILRNRHYQHKLRLMVTAKASNRASVHGIRLPIPDQVDKKEVEKDISKAKEERENKGKEVEKIVDSELKKPSKPYSTIE